MKSHFQQAIFAVVLIAHAIILAGEENPDYLLGEGQVLFMLSDQNSYGKITYRELAATQGQDLTREIFTVLGVNADGALNWFEYYLQIFEGRSRAYCIFKDFNANEDNYQVKWYFVKTTTNKTLKNRDIMNSV